MYIVHMNTNNIMCQTSGAKTPATSLKCAHHDADTIDHVDPQLRAEFFTGNKNIYLHYMLFLHIDVTQVVEIFPPDSVKREHEELTFFYTVNYQWRLHWLILKIKTNTLWLNTTQHSPQGGVSADCQKSVPMLVRFTCAVKQSMPTWLSYGVFTPNSGRGRVCRDV